ncbi:MAG: hypothetical protein R2856_32970 [Caldilineaceae bacterium]
MKPQQAGVFLSIYKDQSTLISSLFFSPENRLCISDAASSGAPACSANTYPVGEWVHTMINFSGNAMTLHLNNSEQVTYQKSSAAWPGAGTYSVSLSGTNFMGPLDDLILDDGSDGGHDGNRAAGLPSPGRGQRRHRRMGQRGRRQRHLQRRRLPRSRAARQGVPGRRI